MKKQDSLRGIIICIVRCLVLILSKAFFWRKNQRIWLIACGGERWGDNADALWLYMNVQHPEIKTVAVMKNNGSTGLLKGEWVKRNSLMNYAMILQAEVLATTHALSDIGPEFAVSKAKACRVWLQHGVIGIKKILATHAVSGQFDLACASSVREKNLMTDELGINPEIIAVTGLARYDVLKEKTEKELGRDGTLYIPTSRAWIDQTMKKEYETMLFSWLEKLYYSEMDIQFKIWLHPGWYKKGLNDLDSKYDNVQLYQLNTDPQQLILESKLLITDYSSVFFDAALSGIPTIFYQPDRVSYINNKGLFSDYLNEKTLLVVENENELITQLEEIINNKEYYQYRLVEDQKWAYKYVETFDGNSCQRIFARINEMIEQRKNHKKVY